MDFITYAQGWAKSEVTQGKVMIGIGLLLMIVMLAIFKSQHELLRGTIIPLCLLLIILLGYGSYIMYSRPAHIKECITRYQASPEEGIEEEKAKHINDNRLGKTLMKYVYPSFLLISALGLFFFSNPYYKGLSIGCALLFLATYVIDYGFVSRSDAFLVFLEELKTN